MIGANSSMPPVSDNETRSFFNLLALVTDPKASAKRVSELYEAALKSNEAAAEAKKATDQLAIDRAAHDAQIAKELKEHNERMASERKACDKYCSQAMGEVQQAKAEAERLNSQARADATAAAGLKASLEKIRQAITI
jgi:hypothetical protein